MEKREGKEEIVLDSMEELEAEESTGKKILNTVINVIMVLAIIVAAVCTYVSYVSTSGNGVPSILGIRVFSIQTESMYPTLEPGDLIFGKGVKDSSELEVDDIITYWTVINGERVLNTHRIVGIYDGGNHLIFETQGDNNTSADPLTVHESEVVAQYNGKKIDGLGKVFDYLQTSTGFLLVVVLPVAIFFLYHLIQFFRVLFEYNNVKNKLLYEMERGKNEDMIEEEKRKFQETKKKERERLEAELREKLRAELLAASALTEEETEEEETLIEETTVEEAVETVAAETPEIEDEAERKAKERAEMEARIRAEMEAEAKAKAEAEAAEKKRAEERAAMEAEIRAQIRAEMEAEAKAKAELEGATEKSEA